MGYSGIPTTISNNLCTSSRRRSTGIYCDPRRTLAGFCFARNDVLHLVFETLARVIWGGLILASIPQDQNEHQDKESKRSNVQTQPDVIRPWWLSVRRRRGEPDALCR